MFFKSQPTTSTSTTNSSKQDYATIEQSLKSGGQLIDVRTPEEFSAGHIQDSINLPLQDIEVGKYPSGAKDQTIYLYCRSGNRSGQAKAILKNAGYTNVTNLGAMTSVEAMGGKVVN